MNIAEQIKSHVDDARDIFRRRDVEQRQLTPDERVEVEQHIAAVDKLKAQRDAHAGVEELGRNIGTESYVSSTDPNASHGDGWAQVARALGKGQKHVEVPTASLLTKRAGSFRRKDLSETDLVEGVVATIPGFAVLGADRRFLYPHLQMKRVNNELSVSDFRQTGSRSVSGDVERELTGTGSKATLDLEVKYVTQPLKQVAIIIEDVPNALLQGVGALQPFLASEAQYQLSVAIDNHVIQAIEFSDHPFDAEGEGPIARIRNALAAHRALGYNPTVAAVSPGTAAELDLTLTGGGYEFNTQSYGSAGPLFGLELVEVATVVDPLLIDPTAIGVLALGPTKVDVDQSSGFSENLSSVRVEASVLFVQRVTEAVYEIGIAS